MALVLRVLGVLFLVAGALILLIQVALAAVSLGSALIVAAVFGLPALACLLLARRMAG
jgi:hypothetical protein